jgi:hypothetical protein
VKERKGEREREREGMLSGLKASSSIEENMALKARY